MGLSFASCSSSSSSSSTSTPALQRPYTPDDALGRFCYYKNGARVDFPYYGVYTIIVVFVVDDALWVRDLENPSGQRVAVGAKRDAVE
jgi:hypothetical protein